LPEDSSAVEAAEIYSLPGGASSFLVMH